MKDSIPDASDISQDKDLIESLPGVPSLTRPSVDMSSEAIDRRLRIVSELYTLGMAIQSGRFVEPK